MSRFGGRAARRSVIAPWCVLLLTSQPPKGLSAQDTTRTVSRDTTHRAVADTGIGPGGAFRRSLLLPGWGQAVTGRHTAGALFVAWEGVTAMMTLKAQREANYMNQIGAAGLKAKRQEVQDWLVLWIFNHLFSGAEAYVAGHLRDFPRDLQIQSVPGGIGVSIPLHHSAR